MVNVTDRILFFRKRKLALLIGILSVLSSVGLVVSICGRVAFPWPLEWMEGAMMHHAVRLVDGDPLFVPPSAEFIPFLYPPLFYWTMAVSFLLFGQSLVAARIPSILALIGLYIFSAKLTVYKTEQKYAAIVVVGLLSLGYGYGGAFYDLARLDMLFLFFVIAGTERLQRGNHRAAMVFIALSCLTKQLGFLFLAAATVWLVMSNYRKHLLTIGFSWIGLLSVYVMMHFVSDSWSTIYLFSVPSWHGVLWELLPGYFIFDLLLLLPLLLGIALFRLWRHRKQPEGLDFMLIAALAASAFGRAHAGGNDNVLLPGFALLAIVASIELLPVLMPERNTLPSFRNVNSMRAFIGLAFVVQMLLLYQPPTHFWPKDHSKKQFQELITALNDCADQRQAVALDFAYLTDTPFLHTMALSDIFTRQGSWLSKMGMKALINRLNSDKAPFSIAVGASFAELDDAIEQNYTLCRRKPAPKMSTGYQPRPMTVYRRKE